MRERKMAKIEGHKLLTFIIKILSFKLKSRIKLLNLQKNFKIRLQIFSLN